MKKDIQTAADIKLLVDDFYKKAIANDALGHIFTEVAKVNWEHHLPIMYAFWESILLGEVGYKGNPMDAHFRLNEKYTLTADHFNTWKFLFLETVDEHFEGEVAQMAKQKAISIADLMFYKIHNNYNSPGVAQPKK
ncbi:group III truncated hemoglobin [Pedobacter cryophilus]|uniref:Group III truncated hemoglobin n=1 Tax=Pedobacter cryophilus TaxID=2571271 RepID=A0A4U1C3J4_9SPHI|nr:group III truncated hemoglobin [Pedobacter cryophilus]TKB98886.1 group III truncated hemoglobin [Pedobacter cryophilus]